MASLHMQLDFPGTKGHLGPLTPQCAREPPAKGPQKALNLCTLAADSPKPKTDHILGYLPQKGF